jgi:hypothetical protein
MSRGLLFALLLVLTLVILALVLYLGQRLIVEIFLKPG